MKRKFGIFVIAVGVSIAFFFVPDFRLTYAQSDGNDDIFLPFVSVGESASPNGEQPPTADAPTGANTATPLSSTPTPTSTPAPTPTPTVNSFDNAAWALPPTPTPTPTLEPSYPAWIEGTYNMRIDTREGWGEFRSDGTFTERWSTFDTAGTRTYTGTWFVNDGQLFSAHTDHNGDFRTAHFLLEETDDGFRLMGGDHKLSAMLFERVEPLDSIGSYAGETVPISRWMRGRWSYLWGITSYQIALDADGHYKLYRAPSFIDDDELPEPLETGQWSIWADQMIILPDGETVSDAHTYKVTSSTRGFIQIEGGRFGNGDVGLLRKRFFPPTSMMDFEGQYLAGDITMAIEKDGDTYSAHILDEGVSTVTTGTLDENNRLILKKGDDDTYDPLAPHYNTISYGSFEFPDWLTKISEGRIPPPDTHHGMWIIDYPFSHNSELWLLPDGRYISKTGSNFQTRGTYSIANDAITYDPLCDSPYSRAVEFVDTQMIQRIDDTILTYHYVPEKLGDIVASVARSDQVEGQLNADFAAAHPLVPRDPGYITVPGGYVVADVNPNDVYADAMVFPELEVYFIIYPYTFPEDLGFYLFPNGRYQFYNRDFIDLGNGLGEYQLSTGWGKYKVEDEVIISISDAGEVIELPLALGRRRAMWNETCLDSLDWVSDDER